MKFIIITSLSLILNQSYSQFFMESATIFEGVEFSSIAFADIDGDNDQDVMITGNNGIEGVARMYINDGSGNFSLYSGPTPFDGVSFSSIAFGDIDNDNDQDVLITGLDNSSQSSTKLYLNDGTGEFTEKLGTSLINVDHGSVDFFDMDNDNDLDLFITGQNVAPSYSKLYANDGTGNFTEVVGTPFIGVSFGDTDIADVDGDLDQDILVTGSGSNGNWASLFLNDGTGNFSLTTSPFSAVYTSAVEFVDIDNDNDQDVLIIGRQGTLQTSKLYENDGSGTFNLITATTMGGVESGDIDFADVNNDNYVDLIITGRNASNQHSSKLYLNDGSGNFTESTNSVFDNVFYSSVEFADVDNDNDQDVLICGDYSSSMNISKLYINDLSSGISVSGKLRNIDVYPNPSNGVFNVHFDQASDATIEVFNLVGQIVYKKTIVQSEFQKIELNQARGTYLLCIRIDDENKQYKITLQ